MYILVTNDDGIDSEGILALKRSLAKVGEVVIIAPDRNWSTTGHAMTLHKPLRVTEVKLADGDMALVSDGTPTDCVRLGVLGILRRQPDLVVSGINKGPNLGDDVTYSGTVAAAMEGVICAIPSIAVSLAGYNDWDFSYAAEFTARLAQHMAQNGLSSEVLLNVNVPNLPKEQIAGVEITRLGKRIYRDVLIEEKDTAGQTRYWIGGDVPIGIEDEGTDLKAIAENKVSVTPIHLDLTNHRLIRKLIHWKLSV
ncbi:MAG: 5'/3'-nucleotidase SurE [Chloroflexi bacterium]|nr:5'/3'-nucleotidase SurE [Chloroflexota bacterium]MCL5076059.1 5'/3'-nucleotidase SurE [Chloroflexota bacterium]